MARHIKSSYFAAKSAAKALSKGLEEFTTLSCSHLSSQNPGRPAAAHDKNISRLRFALDSYRSSQQRDSSALEQMATAFDATDKRMAARLLGFTAR